MQLSCPFQDGDDYHSPENVEKMRNGTPLTDRVILNTCDILKKYLIFS